MAPPKRQSCTYCGRHESEAGPLSGRRICADCGEQALIDNLAQLKAHSGPNFERWRRRIAASVGAKLER